MMRFLSSLFLLLILTGCATTDIKYVEKVVYVPVKVDDHLFKLSQVPVPPGREKFIFLTPKNKDDTILLLKGQRDLLAEYAQDLLKDTGMCRARVSEIYDLQKQQVEIIKSKGN